MGIDLSPVLYMVLAVEVFAGVVFVAGGYLLLRKALPWLAVVTASRREEGKEAAARPRFFQPWALVRK